MNPQDIQKLVQAEVAKQMSTANPAFTKALDNYVSQKTYLLPKVVPHKHDGVDNSRIPESSVIPSTKIMGKINFAQNKTYTLYFTSPNQTTILFNGLAFETGAGTDYVMINGTAIITRALYFQPNNTSSVKVGGTAYPQTSSTGLQTLAQSSSNLYIHTTTTPVNTFGHVDEVFIVNAFSGAGAHIVTGQLLNLTKNSVDFQVTNLVSGWELVGNFTIL